jgi:isopenicillin-N epimerase
MADPFWSAAREQMHLDPTVINLNTGSWGPVPRPVFQHVTELRQRLAEEPMNFFLRFSPPLLWQARQRLATYLHTEATRLVFTTNVSVSINIVASGLRLGGPGEILLTDHEYGAMHWCWERAAQRQGLTLRTFPLPTMTNDPQAIVAAATAAMTERTRLFFFSHVLSPTGLVLPARELCAEARRRGILSVVDGAHAPAFVPLDVDAVNADFYAANLHKWLLAPSGAGFLVVHPACKDRLQAMQVSWGYRFDPKRGLDEPDTWGTTNWIRHLEFEGTRDVCPWIAVESAIDFQEQLGWERIRARHLELSRYVRQRLTGLAGLTLATPDNPAMHGPLTAFRLPEGHDPMVLRKRLWERHRIEAPIVERPGYLMIRTSTHFYNTEEEVDRLAESLPDVLGIAT